MTNNIILDSLLMFLLSTIMGVIIGFILVFIIFTIKKLLDNLTKDIVINLIELFISFIIALVLVLGVLLIGIIGFYWVLTIWLGLKWGTIVYVIVYTFIISQIIFLFKNVRALIIEMFTDLFYEEDENNDVCN